MVFLIRTMKAVTQLKTKGPLITGPSLKRLKCLTGCRSWGQERPVSTGTTQSNESEDLLVDYLEGNDAGVVVFGLNRPAAKNSFSKNLVARLFDAVEAVRFDRNARVVIIRSTTPGIFCAGADLKERAKMPPSTVGPFVAKARKLISDLEGLPMPVIAALDGHALGKAQVLF